MYALLVRCYWYGHVRPGPRRGRVQPRARSPHDSIREISRRAVRSRDSTRVREGGQSEAHRCMSTCDVSCSGLTHSTQAPRVAARGCSACLLAKHCCRMTSSPFVGSGRDGRFLVTQRKSVLYSTSPFNLSTFRACGTLRWLARDSSTSRHIAVHAEFAHDLNPQAAHGCGFHALLSRRSVRTLVCNVRVMFLCSLVLDGRPLVRGVCAASVEHSLVARRL